jgi:preprotein translocase subunit YajC
MEDSVVNLAISRLLLAFQDSSESSGSLVGFLLPLLIIGGLFYFMLIMPQRRRAKAMEDLRSSIGVGDEVRTVGGIYGVVRSIEEDEMVIDVGGGTTLRFAKRAVAEKLTAGE